jgi:hypothetical protein
MKSNAIAAIGIAVIDLPLAVKPDPFFRIARTEMKGGTSAALASLAVAQVHPIRFTCGNYSKGAAVALPDTFQIPLPPQLTPVWPIFSAAVEQLREKAFDAHMPIE